MNCKALFVSRWCWQRLFIIGLYCINRQSVNQFTIWLIYGCSSELINHLVIHSFRLSVTSLPCIQYFSGSFFFFFFGRRTAVSQPVPLPPLNKQTSTQAKRVKLQSSERRSIPIQIEWIPNFILHLRPLLFLIFIIKTLYIFLYKCLCLLNKWGSDWGEHLTVLGKQTHAFAAHSLRRHVSVCESVHHYDCKTDGI